MKKFLLSSLLAAGFALGVTAQDIIYLLNNGTVPIGLSNVYTFSAVRGADVTIQATTKLTGAGTSGIGYVIDTSVDNSNWSTTPNQFWRAANGATAVSHLTNFNITSAPFVRLTVHNTNSVAVTNSTITVNVKRLY